MGSLWPFRHNWGVVLGISRASTRLPPSTFSQVKIGSSHWAAQPILSPCRGCTWIIMLRCHPPCSPWAPEPFGGGVGCRKETPIQGLDCCYRIRTSQDNQGQLSQPARSRSAPGVALFTHPLNQAGHWGGKQVVVCLCDQVSASQDGMQVLVWSYILSGFSY